MSARKQDKNGFLFVKGCPISSFGIFDYSAAQLGLDGDPNRIVKVYRPESAVNDPETLASFQNVPFIVDHEMLSGFIDDDETMAPEEYGVDGVLTSNVYYDAPWMRGDIKVFSRKAQRALQQRKKDLSLGYSCDWEVKPGVWNGQPYEVIQTNLRGNHIALVDEGRVPGARVLDGLVFDHLNFDAIPSDEDKTMAKKATAKTAKDSAVEQLQALMPQLNAAMQEFLKEEATEPAHEGEGAVQTDPNADPNAAPNDGGEAATQATTGTEGGDLPSLIAKVEAVLAQLKASVGADPATTGDEGEGTNGGETQTKDSDTDPNAEGAGADEGAGAEEGNGKASPGPAAGENATAGDAAIRSFYADLAAKDRIYNRVSKLTGSFDHSAMDARQVAAYGVKKLGLQVKKGVSAMDALEAYLDGHDAAAKKHKAAVQSVRTNNVGDSLGKSDELDRYLKGSN
ncbi:hypothetical protein PLUTO_00210 [Luteibacter phage vB_LflM-Pluto]|uniref:DUF2213 domain-containing protein n=1 Tax=Luteibacter phage vB_LflM-Pluto TaxID=2948611 RepID=A0A9E7MUG8_9CAUD|nr:hypothetical protein PLUTO_00210 [Luteibacter phage vB_LflM-Pluto]